MVTFWFWLIAVFFSLIVGAILIFIFYGGLGMLIDSLIVKKHIPKNKSKVSEYILEHPEKFENTNPGLPSDKEIKEVKEDERRRREKYREFEKLRQTELERRTGKTEESESSTPRTPELPRNAVLPIVSNPRNESSNGGSPQPTRRLKLDD